MNLRLAWRGCAPGRRQRGSAAVEFAVLLPCLALALAPMIFCARYMWHYTVAQKAAQDASRYMSMVPVVEMRAPALAVQAKEVALEIARRELGELAPGEELRDADVLCDSNSCGFRAGTVPRTVKVSIMFYMHDPIFHTYLGPWGVPIEVNAVTPYVGK